MAAEALTIGVVASMKRGLEPFVHRELAHLQRLGHRIRLLPTKVGAGLYAPDPTWTVLAHHPWRLAAGHLATLARAPRRYVAALAEAWRFRALAEFALAAGHAPSMRDVDVLYATFGDRKLFVGYFLKRLNGTRLAVTVHAYELYDNPNPALFRHALAACDRVSTVTEYNRDLLTGAFGLDPATVAVTRIAVDTERYRPRATFAILIVAFFNDGKGHEDLFEAVRLLDDPDVEVWVVGGAGPAAPVDVRAAAARHGVADQVAFFGPLRGPPLEALYRRCDVFCLPSHTAASGIKEGFPTVIAEAMAFGRPVVSTRHVEIPRILDEALVDERDVAGLAATLRALRDDPARRAAMGAENRRRAERLFTLRNVEATGDALVALARADAGEAAAGARAAGAEGGG